MTTSAPKVLKAFKVGPLNVGPINRALGLELDTADVWVSKACHEHIWYDHPDDYDLIISNIVDIFRNPTWAGQDPKHGSNFYIVQRIPAGADPDFALVAMGLELSKFGTYSVKSAYAIKRSDVDSRILRGSLIALLPE